MTVAGAGAEDAVRATDRNNRQAIFKNFAPFIDNITKIKVDNVDNAKDLNVDIPMYSLIQYSDNYSKKSGSLYQFCRDEPNNDITESESFKLKSKLLESTTNESFEI